MNRAIQFLGVLFFFGIAGVMFSSGNQETNLIFLKNDKIEIGILPEVGGRIVVLRIPGQKNILKSDPSQWADANSQKPKITASANFVGFNGHITWVSPQKEWWQHQDLSVKRKVTMADWPPDPFTIYSEYDVVEKKEDYIKLAGPASPVTGLSFTKEFTITADGKVNIKVTAKNEREKNVSWDLWMLTRLDGFAKVYVPINKDGVLDLVIEESSYQEVMPHEIVNDYFTFLPSAPENGKPKKAQEAHLNPSANYMAGFTKEHMLLITFDKLDQKLIHPNHGLVELYNSVEQGGKNPLLELEIHGAYKNLAPGDTMTIKETWEVFEYKGADKAEEQIKFLEENKD